MIKKLLLILPLFTSSIFFSFQFDVAKIYRVENNETQADQEEYRISSDFASQIQQSNNTTTPTQQTPITQFPAVIRLPGNYILTQNVTVPANQNGLTILTGNVIIDLNGFVITGLTGSLDGIVIIGGQTTATTAIPATSNTTANTTVNANNGINNNFINHAINNNVSNVNNVNINVNNINNTNALTNNAITVNNTLARPGRNITIRNGTIQTMGRNGILVSSTANNGINTRYVNLENLQILDCGTSRNGGTGANGVNIIGGIDFTISNCLFSRNSNVGLLVTANQNNLIISQNFIIENCISSFNLSDGFQFNNCNNYTLKNILALNNGLNGGIGGNGIIQNNGIGMNFSNCQAYGNRFNGISSTGNNHIFVQCQSDINNLAGFVIGGNNNSLYNCSAVQNSTQGFNISGSDNTFETCEAKSTGNNPNAAPPAGTTVAGFLVAGTCHTLLENIASSNNGTGILLLPTSSRCQVRSNTVNCNINGITNNGTSNRIYANYASDNTTNFIGVPNVAISPVPAAAINFTTNIEN